MPAPVTPGDDPRLAQLLARLPDLGVPVLPLDYERVARVFAPGRELGWEAARELLAALLAKDEEQRRIVRREYRRHFPPVEEEAPAKVEPTAEAAPAGTGSESGSAAPTRGQSPAADRERARIVRTPVQRRWPIWRLALAGAALALLASVVIGWLWFREEPLPTATAGGPPPTGAALAPGELPADPIPYFHDWVPVIEPLRPADALVAWLPPLALLLGGVLGGAWLWERGRALREPRYDQVDFDPGAEPVLTWSPADLRLPGLLTATQRREMVWGVQRFESEHATPLLDVPATVRGSAEAGLPELRFARARYEREVWLWLDARLRTREAVALAEQVEHDLKRAGLRVRRATFPAVPDKIRFATRERASPLDLGSAARQALVAVFTDAAEIARTLERPDSDQAAELQRILRELRTWPRLCLVDFSGPELDLPAFAARLGLACVAPHQLPAWLAERALQPTAEGPPRISDFDLRLWAAACALPHLPVTAPQAHDLYRALGLPPAWRLPAPAEGRAGADGIRFSDAERRRLLADLARWAWEDGRDGEAARCLEKALTFWGTRLADSAATLEKLSRKTPGARDWDNGRAEHEDTIERRLLALWRGDTRAAEAARDLWDLYSLYESSDQGPLQGLKRLIRERLGALSAHGLGGTAGDGRIVLPWSWRELPEAPPEPGERADAPGTARQRLLRMGFAGAEPGGRRTLGADTRVLLGAFAGIALAGLIGLGRNITALDDAAVTHDAPVYEGPLFRQLVTEREHDGRLYAASRKLTAARELVPGQPHLRVHWCWSGLPADRAAEPCRALYENADDPRRVNVLRLGDSALLRAGSLAEPIRACAEGWPDLSVAVIAADPWTWPQDKENDKAARQLAIRLLDSGAVDLALIGPPDWSAAEELAREWAFVPNGQWLFFSPLPSGEGPGERAIPALGRHRALIRADYAKLAAHLRDKVDGVLDPTDPRERLSSDIARVETTVGKPRLWGGPEVAKGPAGIDFVRVCPGTFTMGSAPAPAKPDEHLRPSDDEQPAHPVILDAFEIARTELTGAQYARITGKPRPTAPDESVASIDWNEARDFCERIEPNGDLPTEAQWEYAARGGAQTPYPFPPDLETLCRYANGAGNETPYDSWKNKDCSDPYKGAAPVGSFPANPLGLYDMHGNLWEWVRDCYDAGAYAGRGPGPTNQPIEEGVGCRGRVLRGGSFGVGPRHLRSAGRLWYVPGLRFDHFGFRCVRGSVRQSNH